MKALNFFSLLFALQFVGLNAYAFQGHSKFKVEKVKPWGEFGFRAIGTGSTIAEMRFDCSQASKMGLIVTVVNDYGKSSNIVLPAGKLGSDKHDCHKNLDKYFASIYSRNVASKNEKQQPKFVELSVQGGIFSSDQTKKTLTFF